MQFRLVCGMLGHWGKALFSGTCLRGVERTLARFGKGSHTAKLLESFCGLSPGKPVHPFAFAGAARGFSARVLR